MAPRLPRTYTFTVAGRGPFPIDMLRYDTCRPRYEADSGKIEHSYYPRNRDTHHVTLVGPKAPTEARWASFGWAVEEVE